MKRRFCDCMFTWRCKLSFTAVNFYFSMMPSCVIFRSVDVKMLKMHTYRWIWLTLNWRDTASVERSLLLQCSVPVRLSCQVGVGRHLSSLLEWCLHAHIRAFCSLNIYNRNVVGESIWLHGLVYYYGCAKSRSGFRFRDQDGLFKCANLHSLVT